MTSATAVAVYLSPKQEKLMHENLDLVSYIARQMNQNVPMVTVDEFASAGNIGLMAATRNFDDSVLPLDQFRNYAKFRIRGSMVDLLRAFDYGGRAAREKTNQLAWAVRVLEQEYQRQPTELELANYMKMTVERLRRLKMLLDSAFLKRGTMTEAAKRQAVEADLEAVMGIRLQFERVQEALLLLQPRQRRVIVALFLQELPASVVGEELGIKESRVSQIKTEAIVNLRRHLLGSSGDKMPPKSENLVTPFLAKAARS